MNRERAAAAIAAVEQMSRTPELDAVLELAHDALKTLPQPVPMRKIIGSRRQQQQFRVAELHGWRGGCDHRKFIPVDVLTEYEAETDRLLVAAGDSFWKFPAP